MGWFKLGKMLCPALRKSRMFAHIFPPGFPTELIPRTRSVHAGGPSGTTGEVPIAGSMPTGVGLGSKYPLLFCGLRRGVWVIYGVNPDRVDYRCVCVITRRPPSLIPHEHTGLSTDTPSPNCT